MDSSVVQGLWGQAAQKAAAWMRFIIRPSSGCQGKTLLAKRSSQTSFFPMTFQDCLQLASLREDSPTHLG